MFLLKLLGLVLLSENVYCGVTKDRVIDQKLSDFEFGTFDYDHEAFLGKEKAKTVASLTLEEKQKALT